MSQEPALSELHSRLQRIVDECIDGHMFAFDASFLGTRRWVGVPRPQEDWFSCSDDFDRLRSGEDPFYFVLLEFDLRTIEQVHVCRTANELAHTVEQDRGFHYWVIMPSRMNAMIAYAPPDMHWDVAGSRTDVEAIIGMDVEQALSAYLHYFRAFPEGEVEFHRRLVSHYRTAASQLK